MSLSNEDVVATLGNMTVIQLCELTRDLEAKWGVKAVPQVVQQGVVPTQTAPDAIEQTEFDVILDGLAEPTAKMAAIKLVREVTGLGLKEAKDMIEALPKVVRTAIPKADAEDIAAKFKAAGVQVTLK
jgi:large subunit ribosomal protein L7/L12